MNMRQESLKCAVINDFNIKNIKFGKIKTQVLITFLILNIVIFQFCINSFSENNNTIPNSITTGDHDEANEEENAGAFEMVSQSDDLEFYCNMQNGSFIIRNKKDNSVWKSFLDESEIASEIKPNEKWIETMSSLVLLHYTNYVSKSTIPSSNKTVDIKCKNEDGNLEIEMDFTQQKISLMLKIWIEEDVLHIQIPSDKINEYGSIGIMQIDVLPFLMSSKKGDEGYILNPDGCGALCYFREEILPYANKRYSFPVYSKPIIQLGPERYEDTDEDITTELIDRMSDSKSYNVAMPICGMKKNGSAALCIISKGEANALINIEPYGYAVAASRVFPSIVYREAYKDPRPEIAKMLTYFEEKCVIHDSHIKYVFLSGEEANYSGMANAYRRILLDENGFKLNAGKFSCALSLFCGIEKDQVLFKSFISSTTFDQAAEILKKIQAPKLIVNLKGSANNGYGYFNQYYAPAANLGGKYAFLNMMEYANEIGASVYVEENFIDILPDVSAPLGFNSIYIRDPNNMVISDNKQKQFIVNPKASYDIFESKYMKTIKKYDPDGITFARMGELIYKDKNKKRETTVYDCLDTWLKFMDTSNSNLGGCAVEGGNIYAAKKSDWLYGVPMDTSGCPINDEEVPFYQMVLHGLIDYSGTPGNLSPSFLNTMLKWVEYGCIPYFELTYSGNDEIMKTFYDKLYSSSFETWEETVKATFDEFNMIGSNIQKATIVKHEKYDADKVKITYDNGVKIYVNYGENEWKADSLTVPSKNYAISN